MRTHQSWGWAGCALALALAAGCAASDKKASGAGQNPADSTGGAGTGGTGTSNGSFADAGAGFGGAAGTGSLPALPPEKKTIVDLQLPQASDNYVYTTNPTAGVVSVIDAKMLSIRTLQTGEKPTYLRTLKNSDNAIVLNIGSSTATVIRSTASKSTTSDLDVVQGANAIGVTADGKHAVVYYNSSYTSAGNTSGSYQDVSVLSLSKDGATDKAVSMTVGFRPRDVFFSSDNTKSFVVTEDGVSVLDFALIEKNGSSIAQLWPFGGGVDQKTLDVSVTPDGKYALARAEGKSLLQLIDLSNGKVKTLDVAKAYVAPPPVDTGEDAGVSTPALPIAITDLELVPTGTAAIAVLRNQSAMVTLPLPGVFDDPTKATTRTVSGEIVGSASVTPDGTHALLYTTAANVERITIVDLVKNTEPKVVALRKAVLAVTFTPDSRTALITHTKLPGDPNAAGITPDDAIDRSYGYSLLRVPSGDVKLQVTQTSVGPIAMVSDKLPNDPLYKSYLFILFRDDTLAIKEVHRVDLASFLVNPIIQLESPPISIGAASKSFKVFVNQDHPDGRMTFIDWRSPDMKNTVTGFELNSRIRN